MASPQSDLPLPDQLLGVLFDDERGFVETACLTEEDDISDEQKCTLMFEYDEWFEDTLCNRCKANLITNPNKKEAAGD